MVLAQGQISGSIIDKMTREPVEGALITLLPSGTFKIADSHGNFTLQSGKNSIHLRVSCIGYAPKNIVAGKDQFNIVELEAGIISLQELVIAPSVSVQFSTISKIDLNLRPLKSSQELLRIVPGLFIAQHQGGGKAEQIFLRGFDIDHGTDIAVHADGMPVNMVSHAHGQGYADMHFVIPELVKNIDYGKGPYYTTQGNFNTAGYVNLQTLHKLDKTRIQVEAGQFNTMRTLAMINLLEKNSPRQNAYLAGEFLYSDGPFKSPQHFNRLNLFGKYNFAFGRRNELSFIGSAFSSNWNASGQVPQRAVLSGMIDRFGAIDDTESGFTGRYNATVKLQSQLNNGAQLENQVYFSRYYFNLFSNFTFFLNDPVNGDQIKQRESRNIWGYHSKYTQTKEWKSFSLNSHLGAGFRLDLTDNSELSHTSGKVTSLQEIQKGNIREFNGFLYVDETLQKGNWAINVGGRFDHFRFNYTDRLFSKQPGQVKTIFSPKMNIQYSFNKDLQVFAKSGKGFHSNDTRVVVANQGREILPAAYGADLGAMWKPFPQLLIKTVAWYLYLQQEFVYVGDEGIVEPSGKSRRFGFDVSGRYQLIKNLFADLDVNFCEARDVESDQGKNHIPLAPVFTSTGGINYQSKTGLNGSLRYRFIMDRPANEDNSVKTEGYFVTDLSLNFTKKRYELGIILENLFNTKWNEAQFETESRLKDEPSGISELHFTPGVPFYLRAKLAVFL